jgi:uncharacterized protein YegP (UPF0339 family)
VAKPRFEIRRKRSDQFHFVLIGGNGQVVVTSENYTSKVRAKSGVASVQKIAAAADVVDLADDAGKTSPKAAKTTAATSTGRAKTAGTKAVAAKPSAAGARRATSK